jgi:biopolymer transport protein TolR
MPKVMPNEPPSGHRGRRRGPRVSTALSEINVVPLVDVMLVLLVIFMVAAPMLQQGFPVNLPKSRQSRAVDAPLTVTVPLSFRKDQRVQLGKDFVPFNTLAERIRQEVSARSSKRVILAGDGAITYSELMMVWDKLNEGGVESVNMQTQPSTDR